jgi:two-component sensor histidine kinase
VGTLDRLLSERTDLSPEDGDLLVRLVEEWSVLADLALSDLLLWVPTWNEGGLVAVAQVRPSTAPTTVPDDVIGRFVPRGRNRAVDQALAFGRAIVERDASPAWAPASIEAYPVSREGRVIAVLARHASAAPRVAGRLEEIYLSSADDLFAMIVEGTFPSLEEAVATSQAPRVGDGLVRLTPAGVVEYASPNAVNAMRRLGLARDVVGSPMAEVVVRLAHRPGPVDSALSAVASGRAPGGTSLENNSATVLLHGIPLRRAGERIGALIFCRDVTDLRRREQALLSKDATIREIHHRVKNNLQTVAAMLRMQGRRAATEETRVALAEAELRVAAIAVVHESLSVGTAERVDFDAVVDRIVGLVGDLAPAYSIDGTVPRITREGSWGLLPAEFAVPMAMAVSELLNNAVEHATASQVRVRLAQEAGEGLLLEVSDDGMGLPEGFSVADAGLGLSIVDAIVRTDLDGSLTLASDGGAVVTIRVPED